MGRLHQRSARELAEWARSDNPLEAGIGLAAVNSLLDVDERNAIEINTADVLAKCGRRKNMVLVGDFAFIPTLRIQVGRLRVIEQHAVEGENPTTAAPDLISQADVVAITGSALINHTLEGLLALCRRESLVMVVGPSTPLWPVLFVHGAAIASGARVVDEAAVLRTVGQGATFRQVEGVRLPTLSREKIHCLSSTTSI